MDDQPNEYTIEVLREIKRKHEEWVDETLEWRAGLPDSLWAKLKEEGEELLLARAEEVDSDVGEFLERLGIFVLMTADLLGAPELVFFVRGQGAGASLAFKFEADSVFFAHAEFDGFEAGFSAFDLAPTIEDHTIEVRALQEGSPEDETDEEDETRIFTLAASGLLQIAERIESGDAVFYIRNTPPSDTPQLAFRVEEGDVLFAAGPAETFDEAHEDFAAADPIDITETVRVKMFLDTCAHTMEEDDEDAVQGFLANHFAINVLGVLDESAEPAETKSKEKLIFAELLRNRFYEALLMLGAAHRKPSDPEIRAWMEENMDPHPPDGLSAALPAACRTAVWEFAEEMSLDEESSAELEDEALDSLYGAISLLHEFDENEEVQEPLAILILERLEWWRSPEAREEIAEMAHRAA